jgi:excinuclease ABC subunit A
VVTGVSGSGKSSLVFDTIYAEGQRRYVESLSAYARQFLERMEKPDVDEIDGIAPPIAIRQKNTTRNPRSTVATSTELYDFCACCGRAPAAAIAPTAAIHVRARHGGSGRAEMLAQPGRLALVRAVSGARRRRNHRSACATISSSCARKASTGSIQNGRVFEFSTPESLLDIDFSSRFSRWWTASPSRPTCTSASSTPSRSAIAKPAK